MRRILSFAVLGVLVLCHCTWGEDQIRLKSGEVLRGTATKFDEGSMTLTFKFDKGTLGYSQADLAEVILAERPGVVRAGKRSQRGIWMKLFPIGRDLWVSLWE